MALYPKDRVSHPHIMYRNGEDNGWACDGRNQPRGCRRGITGFGQTRGVIRYRCAGCDYDLCDLCGNELMSPSPVAVTQTANGMAMSGYQPQPVQYYQPTPPQTPLSACFGGPHSFQDGGSVLFCTKCGQSTPKQQTPVQPAYVPPPRPLIVQVEVLPKPVPAPVCRGCNGTGDEYCCFGKIYNISFSGGSGWVPCSTCNGTTFKRCRCCNGTGKARR